MAKGRLTDTLAVILHADVAGSTGLVQQNEQIAHQRIQETFRRFGNIIKQYHGQVRELRGDALLAEFERPSGAVSAALAFQANHGEYLTRFNDGIRPRVRVGIAMGEVVVADDTITGEGVVLAQRLEQLAQPDAVVIQASAYETIPGRFPFDFADLGEQEVKGFDKPVRAYSANLKKDADLPPPERADHRTRNTRVAITVIVVVAIGVALMWYQPREVREEPASPESKALTLSDKPSIAVLPFLNMSDDFQQEYFADGMTEDLITDMSKVNGLFVIARNSTFAYKDQPIDVRKVAEELGVRYVLEGSVRRNEDKIRINAQLIDATTGGHLWAERYDGDMGDVFILQDKITEQIVTALAVKLDSGERSDIGRPYTNSVEAYDNFLLGRVHFFRRTKEDNALAQTIFQKVIELDPAFAQAYSLLAWSHTRDVINSWSETPVKSLKQAYESAQKAIQFDDELAQAYFVMALVYRSQKDHVKAAEQAEKAIQMDPDYADAYVLLASLLYYSGGAEEGLKLMHKAKQLNPNYPSNYPFHLGQAHFLLRQYEDAVDAFQAAIDINPTSQRSHVWLAATYGQSGQFDDAEFEAEEILILDPDFSVQRTRENVPLKVPNDIEHFIEGLRKAGLPE
ncbi:MAG: tetratricopeptide repeat protein [Gammaproteobacteria bacterium]|nr:tetratricopeptide repeat protein [Gammaproteobacteria bacterium]